MSEKSYFLHTFLLTLPLSIDSILIIKKFINNDILYVKPQSSINMDYYYYYYYYSSNFRNRNKYLTDDYR